MIWLVEIRQEAPVATCHAAGVWIGDKGIGPGRPSRLEAVLLEMHNRKCFAGDRIERLGLLNEAGERARTALDGFIEEQGLAIDPARGRLGEDFALFELENGLDPSRERVLDCGQDRLPLEP